MTTLPPDSASAGTNSRVRRNAPRTLVSKPARTWSKSTVCKAPSGGIAKALLTRASSRPNSASVASTRFCADSSELMSVPTCSVRRPSCLISSATSPSRDSVRAASTTSAPAFAHCSAIERPSPGPTPATTTTLSGSRTRSSQHPVRHGGLAGRDACPPLLGRDLGLLVVRKRGGQVGEAHLLDLRPVGRRELPRRALPADLQVPAADARCVSSQFATPGSRSLTTKRSSPSGSTCAWSAVSDVWWFTKSIETYHMVPSWKPWYGRVRLRHGDDQRLVVGQVVVADRGVLRGQAARRQPRLGHRVDRQLQVEPLGELQEGLQLLHERLGRRVVAACRA